MRSLNLTVTIPCRSRSAQARWYLLANCLMDPKDRLTQTAIAKKTKVTVQNVNEQVPRLKKLLKELA